MCWGLGSQTLGLGFKANAYLWSEMFWWFPSSTAMRIGQSKISNKHDSNHVSKPRGRAYITWGVVRDVLNQCLTLHTSRVWRSVALQRPRLINHAFTMTKSKQDRSLLSFFSLQPTLNLSKLARSALVHARDLHSTPQTTAPRSSPVASSKW